VRHGRRRAVRFNGNTILRYRNITAAGHYSPQSDVYNNNNNNITNDDEDDKCGFGKYWFFVVFIS